VKDKPKRIFRAEKKARRKEKGEEDGTDAV
jgi:hypothetical protein